ncbi:MAG TPA: histidine kinase [Longimicrobium sp.]|nr:histidine kinase [Longimicrobium sp.]
MSTPAVHEHTVAGAVAGAFRRSPRAARLYFACAVLYIVGMLGWMLASRPGLILKGPFYAALLGGASGIMMGFATMLFNVAQGDAWRQRGVKWGVTPKRMTEMLLALPVLAFVAGAMAAAATAVMAPYLGRNPVVLFGMVATVYVTAAAGKMTADGTRWLYGYARQQADAAERARAEASDAQLAALQAQVNPHFLFNALNTIAALVRTDPPAAERTTENLARVLRRTLDRTGRTDCTVDDEIDYLRAWLAVESERYGERLRVDFDVDPSAADLRIPTMTLQPLVENSLKHGIAGKLEGGRVAVRVHREDGRLRLEVEDDGAGFPREPRDGTGLGNLRRRLETIYGPAAELRIERPPAGARVVVELPASSPKLPPG